MLNLNLIEMTKIGQLKVMEVRNDHNGQFIPGHTVLSVYNLYQHVVSMLKTNQLQNHLQTLI